jgi:hypothetical protein
VIVTVPPGVSDAGATDVITGVAAVTVTIELPLLPSLVAVKVALPAATPVAVRTFETKAPDATFRFEDVHVNTRPVSTFPFASFAVAVRTVVAPTATEVVAGATVTVATGNGAVTVMTDVPVFPSLVAVIVAGPAAIPVTNPVAVTVAFVASDVDHVTTRPVSTAPPAASVVAVSC